MPVAVAPVNRQRNSVPSKLHLERFDQLAVLPVDGTHTAEVVVMFGHFQHPLARRISSTKNILEERNYVFAPFGSTERDQQKAIIRFSHSTRYCCFSQCSRGARAQPATRVGVVRAKKSGASGGDPVALCPHEGDLYDAGYNDGAAGSTPVSGSAPGSREAAVSRTEAAAARRRSGDEAAAGPRRKKLHGSRPAERKIGHHHGRGQRHRTRHCDRVRARGSRRSHLLSERTR